MQDKNKADIKPGDSILIPAIVSGVNRGTNGRNLVAFPIGTDGKPIRTNELELPATSAVKGTIESLTPKAPPAPTPAAAASPAPAAKPVRKIAVKPGDVVELDATE